MGKMCIESGCDRITYARGWCRPHYDRWWRSGDIEPIATPERLPLPPVELRAWAAGFFDGEGSVRIEERHSRGGQCSWRMGTHVTQDDRRPLDLMASLWGGYIGAAKPRPNGNVSHYWRLSSEAAAVFLSDIAGFAIVKADAIRIALDFRDGIRERLALGNTRSLPVDEVARRRRLRSELQAINRGENRRAGGIK